MRTLRALDVLVSMVAIAMLSAAVNAFHVSARFNAAGALELSGERHDAGVMWLALAAVSAGFVAVRSWRRSGRAEPA